MSSPTPRDDDAARSGTTKPAQRTEARSGASGGTSVLGRLVLMLFVLEAVTGGLLMTVYTPATTMAWGSVHHIQTQVRFGWLIRGLHAFGSDAMIVVLVLYLLQMLATRLYLAVPRFRWSLVVCLFVLTAVLAHTGYLLPWDQQAYWGTHVRINIIAMTPWIGPALRRLLIGGSELGQASITQFYTLHVLLLPLVFLLLVRIWWRRPGTSDVTPAVPHGLDARGTDEVARRFRGSLMCAMVLGALIAACWYAHRVLGNAMLAAPADPAVSDYPARPEWYMLFLFQWLKLFDGHLAEVLAAIVVPGAMLAVFLTMPFWDRVVPQRIAHALAIALVSVTLVAVGGLTYAAVRDDKEPSEGQMAAVRLKQDRDSVLSESDRSVLRAWTFHRRREGAQRAARRSQELAERNGIPPVGPLALLATDPQTRGPQLFAQHCAACHRFDGHDGLGMTPSEPATSSDLAGYASRSWIRALLTNPMNERFFGLMRKPDGTPAHTRMKRWTGEMVDDADDEESRRELNRAFDAVAAYLEDESVHPGRLAAIDLNASDSGTVGETSSERDSLLIEGRRFFMSTCNECHSYQGKRIGTFHAPDMYGYGSVDWIEQMIAEPDHETKYRSKGRQPAQMPSFRDRLTLQERLLIAQWLHTSIETPAPGT